jgi:ABC-type nitrate/sulfonate/bicarbonate transport system substrate-binding protein
MSIERNWKIPAIVAGLGILGLAIAGLRPTKPAQHTPAGVDVLRLANNISDGAHLADELQIFEKHRIRIEWTGKQAHGPAAIVSLIAGQNDAAGSISTAMIIARTHGSKLKIVASSTLSTSEAPLFTYLVKDGSPITGKPEDFLGKKVVAAPTTITWYPLVLYLQRAGLDYRKVEFVQLPSPLATEQALRQGSVDVIAGSEVAPPASKLLAEGGVHLVPGISDYAVLGIEQIGGWAMREEFIEQHPDAVRRFVAALAEAYRWGNAHPAEAQAILNRRNEIPREYWQFQKTWRRAPETGLVDRESIRQWIAILEQFGQIAAGSIKPEDVFTNDFNPQAGQSS